MVDILNEVNIWLNQGREFAVATVIKTWRSAPRTEGSAMIISQDGTMIGSVSGGCVESTVVNEALQMLKHGDKPKRLSFGVTDEDAWSVGLSCGGQIDVWLELIGKDKIWFTLMEMIQSNQGCVLVSGLEKNETVKGVFFEGDMHGFEASKQMLDHCQLAYNQHKTQVLEGHFYNVFPARSRLIIIGAAHVSLDLIKLASWYNFETVVVDPRGIFTDDKRIEVKPDEMHTEWPAEVLPKLRLDRDSYVVVLTHDPKIDDQALKIVLDTDVAYIGALGSRKTHAKRTERLLAAGLSEEQIARIHAPVGVSINARQPSEIALSIMAQIIGIKNKFQ